MSRFKIINIVDYIFIAFAVFVLTFSIIQFFVRNIFLSIFLAIIVSFAILFVFKLIINKKKTAQNISLTKKKEAEVFSINFQTLTLRTQLKFIQKVIDENYSPQIIGDHIEYQIKKEKSIILCESNIDISSISIFINIIKPYIKKIKKILILCNSFSDEVSDFSKSISNINISIYNNYDFYDICKSKELFLKENIKIKPNKLTAKYIFKNFFSSTHAKGFFISGLLLLFTSLIIPFKTYYLIFGIFLVVFSIVCKLPKMKPISKNWLEK